jgi:hypothetical protein
VLIAEAAREQVKVFSRMRAFSLKDIDRIRIGVNALDFCSDRQTLDDSYVFCSSRKWPTNPMVALTGSI